MIKKGLYYVEKIKELIESQVNNIKEKLIKFKNEIDNRIKKDLNNYNGIKDIRYLFNEYEYEYEDISYLFNKNELDIYLRKNISKMTLMILNICLMKMKIIMKTRKIKLKQHTKKKLKKVFIMLRKSINIRHQKHQKKII